MLSKLADLGIRRPGRVMLVAALFFLLAVPLGGAVVGQLAAGEFSDPESSSVRAAALVEQASGQAGTPGVIALVATPDGLASGDGRAAVEAAAATLRADPDVAAVGVPRAGGPLVSESGDAALVTATLSAGVDEEEVSRRLMAAFEGRDGVELGGAEIAGAQIGEQARSDLALAELIAFPLLALLAFAFFRGRAVLLPLAVALLTVIGTFLVLRIVNEVYSLSVFSLNIVIGLGLGLAIDYALFMVARFREQLAAGDDVPTAIRTTMQTAGRTVLFSALTVSAALASLVVFPQSFLVSMGIAGATVALVSALATLVLLPALFARMGTRLVPGPRRRSRSRRRGAAARADAAMAAGASASASADAPRASAPLAHAPRTSRYARVAAGAMRRPGITTAVVVIALLLVALPTLRVQWSGVDPSILPSDQSARVVSDAMATGFPQLSAQPLEVVLHGPDAPPQAEVSAYARAIAEVPGVTATTPPQQLDATTIKLDAIVPGSPVEGDAQRTLEGVRALTPPAGTEVELGGRAAEFADQRSAIAGGLPLAAALLVVTTLALLWLMTGSVVLPLLALGASVLTLGATTGVLVLVFQDGRFEGLLGYASQGGVDQANFLVLVAVALAISTDYGVFVLGRIKEAHDRGLDTRAAVTQAIGASGALVSAAAILLAVALGAFLTSRIVFLKQIGLGAIVAVMIDAFVVRTLLLPSTLALLDRWAWWSPRPLRRLHARIGISEGPARTPVAAGSS